MNDPGSIAALDFSNQDAVLNLAAKLDGWFSQAQIGKERFASQGPN
ncbi:hypothetical protein [Nitrosomonas sp. HPC101]|nr:hypothetical protein [Nitrosomonas sp. HPC101]